MHHHLLRLFLTFMIMSTVARALQRKRCGCSQCDHISESLRRCECCVYLLNGKRSLNKRVIHALETTETETEDNVNLYAVEKRFPPEFRPIGQFGRPRTDTANILTSDTLDGEANTFIHNKPVQGVLEEESNTEDNSFDILWKRILQYVNEHEKRQNAYVYLL